MDDLPQLSPTSILVLKSIGGGQIYGYSIMQQTGLPSGTIYPILRRLEKAELIVSRWQTRSPEEQDQRPPRKYYELTARGKALRASDQAPQAVPLLAGA